MWAENKKKLENRLQEHKTAIDYSLKSDKRPKTFESIAVKHRFNL